MTQRADGGTLYLVSTPIGNLEDITARAVRVLREADWIAAEDTRSARVLLDHLGVRTPVVSCGSHNEAKRTALILRHLGDGKRVALISECGTPVVSDPGERIVRAAVEHGFSVVPVPGPSAVLAALTASGLPGARFVFLGFLPRSAGAMREELRPYRDAGATLVIYESPRRIVATLRALAAFLGDRPAAVARELTKVFEEYVRGTLGSVADVLERRPQVKGEIVLVVGGPRRGRTDDSIPDLRGLLRRLVKGGMSRRDAVREAQRRTGANRKELYKQSLDP